MYPTDQDLDYMIEYHSKLVVLLAEAKKTRQEKTAENLKLKHYAISFIHVKDNTKKIHTVVCNCGRKTEYKKPLKSIHDFECPEQLELTRRARG